MKTVEKLFEAIDKLPDTIESVKVPTTLGYFNPPNEEVVPDGGDWRGKIKDIVKGVLALPKGSEVDEFVLNSYFGRRGGEDPYYIMFKSEGFRRFANDMSSGRYGSLD